MPNETPLTGLPSDATASAPVGSAPHAWMVWLQRGVVFSAILAIFFGVPLPSVGEEAESSRPTVHALTLGLHFDPLGLVASEAECETADAECADDTDSDDTDADEAGSKRPRSGDACAWTTHAEAVLRLLAAELADSTGSSIHLTRSSGFAGEGSPGHRYWVGARPAQGPPAFG